MSRGAGLADRYYRAHAKGMDFMASNSAGTRGEMLENDILSQLIELAVNRFEWKNVPDEIDLRFLEMTLFTRGLVVFFKNTEIEDNIGSGTDKFMAMQAAYHGTLDAQNNPTAYTIFGNALVSRTLEAEECVPIWPNSMRLPELQTAAIYAHKIADLDHTIEINNHNARRNKVIVASENVRMSATQINNALDRGEALKVNSALEQMITAIDMGIDVKANEGLSIIRSRLFNEAMSRFGINNSNQDKKERLVADEVSANDDQIVIARRVNLNERQRAARRINKMFDLNITVDYYSAPVGAVNEAEKPKAVEAPEEKV